MAPAFSRVWFGVSREHLSKWLDKRPGALDSFSKQPDAEVQIAAEFVEAIQQVSKGRDFVERVVSEVWDMSLRERAGIKRRRSTKPIRLRELETHSHVSSRSDPCSVVSRLRT